MSRLPGKRAETSGGYVVHDIPFPKNLTTESLHQLKAMTPLRIEQEYSIRYSHSYGQDSPFFAGLSNGVLLGCREPETGYVYATPRGHGMYSGKETQWVRLPGEGTVHAFTVCRYGSEEFLPETPFVLVLVEFDDADTLFLGRLLGVDPDAAGLDWIGMKVRAKYLRNSKLKPTDVYFVPLDEAHEQVETRP
ncbi:MAG: Zn-ribbon domain-containing OB-fold protein [Syntrophobacteraceae bacterium]|nr:Zn-ribbon domain-containing OB-fold protein [Syntrophobacteraceae bacterium]